MLRNLGIRWKILAVLALPLAMMVAAVGALSAEALVQVSQARDSVAISAAGDTFSQLLAALQVERRLSTDSVDDPSVRPSLPAARAATDAQARALRALAGTPAFQFGAGPARTALTRALSTEAACRQLRAQMDSTTMEPSDVFAGYDQIIDIVGALPVAISQGINDPVEASNVGSVGLVLQLVDTTAREQLAGEEMLATAVDSEDSEEAHAQLAIAIADSHRLADALRGQSTTSQRRVLTKALDGPTPTSTMDAMAHKLVENHPDQLDPAGWHAATVDRMQKLGQVARVIDGDARVHAQATVASAGRRAEIAIGGACLVLVVSLLLALVLARRISAPLRRLTSVATSLRDELPGLVEQIQTGTDVLEMPAPDVLVSGRDEVGLLAAAFRDVNATTIQVAQEQARLRAAIAEMFVNVARRNQTLLSRQLSFIDQLERTEEDPDTLEHLFRLDHLATRMRRNAESLLVLAGMEGGRRLRRPMLLSDVVRTAMSEIERYDRVSLAVDVDPLVVAHLALPAAHLLAELIENATSFSDPASTVRVTTIQNGDGVRIMVRDEGLGMTPEEVDAANARIATPMVTEIVGSQRLGFHVVGMLARRLDAEVSLRHGDGDRGTVVTIDCSASLFSSMPPAGRDGGGRVHEQPAGAEGPAARSAVADPENQAPRPFPGARTVNDESAAIPLPAAARAVGLAEPPALPRRTPPQVEAELAAPVAAQPAAPVLEPGIEPAGASAGPGFASPGLDWPSAPSTPVASAAPIAPPAPSAPIEPMPSWAAVPPGPSMPPAPRMPSGDRGPDDGPAGAGPDDGPAGAGPDDGALPHGALPEDMSDPEEGRGGTSPSLFAGFRSRRELPAEDGPSGEAESAAPEPFAPVSAVGYPVPAPRVEPDPYPQPAVSQEPDTYPDSSGYVEPSAYAEPAVHVQPTPYAPPSAYPEPAPSASPFPEPVPYSPQAEPSPSPSASPFPEPVPYSPQAEPSPAPSPSASPFPEPVPYSPQAEPSPPSPSASPFPEPVPYSPQAEPSPSPSASPFPEPVPYSPQAEPSPAPSPSASPFPEPVPYSPQAEPSPAPSPSASPFPEPVPYSPQAEPSPSPSASPFPEPVPYSPPAEPSPSPSASPFPEPVPYSPPAEPSPSPSASPFPEPVPYSPPAATPPDAAGESEHLEPPANLVRSVDVLPRRSSLRATRIRNRRGRPGSPTAPPPSPLLPADPGSAEPWPPRAPAGGDDPSPRDREGAPGELENRSAIASEALTELSRLSYSPAAVEPAAPAPLRRRTPVAGAVAEPAEAEAPAGRRERRASDVRSMLAGFKAGVERGRTSPSAHRPVAPGLPPPETPTGPANQP